jgi:acyl-coenzyme A thioesterase PaaI-like protein
VSDQEYPPPHHVLRDLPFEVEIVSGSVQRAHLAAAGTWSVGALATVVDVLGGSLCAGVVAPDWMATSSLTLRSAMVPPGQDLVATAAVLRAGRRAVTIEVELRTVAGDRVVADAVLAFSRLERRDTNLDLSGRSAEPGTRFGFGEVTGTVGPALEATLATLVLDAAAGVTETAVTPYVRNSFGAVNGGVVAAIAAHVAALTSPDGSGRVDEVAVHHLGQGRHGPVRSSARTVLDDGGRRVVRVELCDAGAPADGGQGDGRLMAVAHVGVCNAERHV